MDMPNMCPDCVNYAFSLCPFCGQVVGQCLVNECVYPLGCCEKFEKFGSEVA